MIDDELEHGAVKRPTGQGGGTVEGTIAPLDERGPLASPHERTLEAERHRRGPIQPQIGRRLHSEIYGDADHLGVVCNSCSRACNKISYREPLYKFSHRDNLARWRSSQL